MATLLDAVRRAVWADFMQVISRESDPIAITKDNLRAAIDAADTWVDANAASFNSALPVAARNGLTPKQKARLLVFVVARRFEET